MVATMSVIFDNGGVDAAAANQTDVDALGPPTIRFKNADDSTIDANDKLVVPGAGSKYSFWKHICLFCDAADAHTINNVGFYTDGANNLDDGGGADSVDVNVGTAFPERNSGSDAGYEVAAADEELVANHGGIAAAVSVFTLTSGEANDLDVSISEAGNIINAANETTNYIVLQMEVKSDAVPGDLTNETGTFSYDEA